MASIGQGATNSAGDDGAVRRGALAGVGANTIWGFLPLLFYLVDAVDPVEVVAVRTACSLVVVGAIVFATGRVGQVWATLRQSRLALALLASAVLLAINWLLYVYAVQTNQVLEGSFGYFINPMVSVALGMVFLGERHSRNQTAALLLALVAIGVQAIGIGGVPVISLGLALSFGLYGFIRKIVRADATNGLAIETLLLTFPAIAYLAFAITTRGPGPLADPRDLAILLATGPATAVPLLLYAFSVRRLRLATVGMLRYIAPSIQFVLAITFFHEGINLVRLVSFALVWASLLLFSLDSFRQQQRLRA